MIEIKEEDFLKLRKCKYNNCKLEFYINRKDKIFCSRNCKQKNKRQNKLKGRHS